MMKKITTLFIFTIVSLAVSAQISWYAKGGLNLSNETGGMSNSKLGFQIGAGMEYTFTNSNWGIQPSLMLMNKRLQQDWISLGENSKTNEATINRTYIQLPVLAIYRFHLNKTTNLVAGVGPYAGYGIWGRYTLKQTDTAGSTTVTQSEFFGTTSDKIDLGIMSEFTLELHDTYTFGLWGQWGRRNIFQSELSFGMNVGYRF